MLTVEDVTREETLSQIDRKEVARRQRALRYESLLGDQTRLRARIADLEVAQHPGQDVTKLEQLAVLCATLHPDTVSNSLGLPSHESPLNPVVYRLPSGLSLRGVLPTAIEGALIVARHYAERHTRELNAATEQLARVELALMTEFPEAQS